MDKKKNNILIVDDEPEIRGLMQEILKEEGYSTFVAKNAREAQKSIDENPPDLVYLDIWMRDKDGVALLKEWSEADKLNFPVIMISGHATIETAVEATRLGAFDFIEKPLSIEKLVESAKKALRSSEKNSEDHIALILKNNCSVYKDVFLTLDNKKDSDQIVFLNGEAGTEKEGFAQYIHNQTHKENSGFATFQLDLLAYDQYDNTEITNELKKTINTVEKGTIFLSGYSDLILKNQTHGFLQKLSLGQGISFVVGLNFNKKEKLYKQNKELSAIISDGILLDLPPLRQCLQDIPGLLKDFIDYFVKTEGLAPRRFSLAAQNVLTKYSWPGN